MKQKGSNLATVPGIAIEAVLLFISAYFRMDALMILIIGLLGISIIAWLWTRSALSRLIFFSGETQAEGFPGEMLSLHAALTNGKILPVIWLRLRVPENMPGIVQAPEEEGVLRSFLWVMPYQTISWEMKLKGIRRGFFETQILRISGGDGFGLAEQETDLRLVHPVSFLVFPALIPVNTAVIRRQVQNLENAAYGRFEDVTLLKHTRSYEYGDHIRRINWRQTARTGEMMVNIYETQEMRHAALALDTEAFIRIIREERDGQVRVSRELREEAFEETVSLCASAAMDLLDHGICCTLILPDRRIAAASPQQGREILRALAVTDPVRQSAGLPDENVFAYRHIDGPMFLFTEKADERIMDWLETWKELSPMAVCTETDGVCDPAVIPAEEVCA